LTARESRVRMKLALGTVQLGIPYGIANEAGRPDDETALEILRAAREQDYTWLDTAAAYGESEAVLGRLMPQVWADAPPAVATKFVLDEARAPAAQLDEALGRLGLPFVDALLLHREDDLDHPRVAEFAALGTAGRTRRTGVSCYDPKRALQGLEAGFGCVQVPCNLFDTHSVDAGVFKRAAECGALVFVRSIFLQGLFFLSPDHPRAQHIPGAVEALRFLRDFCHRHAITPAELAMAFGSWLGEEAVIVLGADTGAQVRENARLATSAAAQRGLIDRWLHERPSMPPDLIHPGRWPKG
jgi:aryl-alcohol dehydrogenase-like predicted oxidoreductase